MYRFGAGFLVTAEAASGIGFSMEDEFEVGQKVPTKPKPERSPSKRGADQTTN